MTTKVCLAMFFLLLINCTTVCASEVIFPEIGVTVRTKTEFNFIPLLNGYKNLYESSGISYSVDWTEQRASIRLDKYELVAEEPDYIITKTKLGEPWTQVILHIKGDDCWRVLIYTSRKFDMAEIEDVVLAFKNFQSTIFDQEKLFKVWPFDLNLKFCRPLLLSSTSADFAFLPDNGITKIAVKLQSPMPKLTSLQEFRSSLLSHGTGGNVFGLLGEKNTDKHLIVAFKNKVGQDTMYNLLSVVDDWPVFIITTIITPTQYDFSGLEEILNQIYPKTTEK